MLIHPTTTAPTRAESRSDLCHKQAQGKLRDATGPTMCKRLNAIGIPAAIVTHKRSGEHAGCYVMEVLNFTWPDGHDAAPTRHEVAPPLTYAHQIRDQLSAQIVDAFDTTKSWRTDPADRTRTSATVIFRLTENAKLAAKQVEKREAVLPKRSGAPNPKPTPVLCLPAPRQSYKQLDLYLRGRISALNIQAANISATVTARFGLIDGDHKYLCNCTIEFATWQPKSPAYFVAMIRTGLKAEIVECLQFARQNSSNRLCPPHVVRIDCMAYLVRRMTVSVIPMPTPFTAFPGFTVGQVLQLPRMALKRPVERVIHLTNIYYEFGTGCTFAKSDTPICYRFSESALLAANPGAVSRSDHCLSEAAQ